MVEAAARALPLGKAVGVDDWAGEELRLWPPTLVAALAAFLRTVETAGRWPAAFSFAEVVLIPKPGADPDLPLQLRPITLLPVVYRLWARLRLSLVDSWRSSWDPAWRGLPKGADGLAWDLAWDLAISPSRGLGDVYKRQSKRERGRPATGRLNSAQKGGQSRNQRGRPKPVSYTHLTLPTNREV